LGKEKKGGSEKKSRMREAERRVVKNQCGKKDGKGFKKEVLNQEEKGGTDSPFRTPGQRSLPARRKNPPSGRKKKGPRKEDQLK